MVEMVPVILVLFVIAAFLRIDFYFKVVYFLAGTYLLMRFWSRKALAHLYAERRFVDRAFPGEQVAVTVSLENKSWLPVPWVVVQESIPVQLSAVFQREVLALGPYERRSFAYTLHCLRRGYYDVGPFNMRGGDLLGVQRPRTQQLPSQHIIVYPRVVPLEKLGLPTHSPLVALPARSPLFEDPARIMGVRDYQPGDSPRRIHWTATASTGRLLVKRYQPAVARETLICLDLDLSNYGFRRRLEAVELAIVTAASIANHIVTREGLAVGLALEAWDPLLEQEAHISLPPRRERAHLMGILEVLARAQAVQNAPPFAELLRKESARLAWGATITIITGGESEGLFDTLLYLRRVGFTVALILLMLESPPNEMQQQADMAGVPVHWIWREEDLEIWSD